MPPARNGWHARQAPLEDLARWPARLHNKQAGDTHLYAWCAICVATLYSTRAHYLSCLPCIMLVMNRVRRVCLSGLLLQVSAQPLHATDLLEWAWLFVYKDKTSRRSTWTCWNGHGCLCKRTKQADAQRGECSEIQFGQNTPRASAGG